MLKRASIYILILFIAGVLKLSAQIQNISYNTLSPSNGLSHITVNSLYQDSNGAIWIATRDGLNCYDGSSVKIFRKERNNPRSLASNNIGQIVGDRSGSLFVTCNDGVWRMDIEREEFFPIFNGHVDAIYYNDGLYIASDNRVQLWTPEQNSLNLHFTHPSNDFVTKSLKIDSKGRMWIGTESNGLLVVRESGAVEHLIEGGHIIYIFEDREGDIWIGSEEEGLYLFESRRESIHHFTHDSNDSHSLPTNFIRAITQDYLGDIWLATDQGLCYYNLRNDSFHSYETPANSSSIWDIITDNQGNIWFGSYFGGVNWFNPEYNIYSRYNMIDSYQTNLGNTVIGRMVEDRRGVLWICTEGNGVFSYDRESGLFQPIATHGGEYLRDENIKSVYYDSEEDILWFGTHLDGLFRYDIASRKVENYRYDPSDQWSLPSNVIRDIASYNGLLILATPLGVASFDPKSHRSERMFIDTPQGRRIMPVSNILVESGNKLWIGTEGRGVYLYDFEHRSLRNYQNESSDPHSLSSNNISTIVEDSRGRIWIGHEGSGFDLYNRERGDFDNFDTRSAGLAGLVSNRVYEICDNLDNTLSVSTGGGLTIFDCESYESYNYSNKMGYTLLSPNENAMYRTSDGMLFIGGVDGLISLNIDKLINIDRREYALKFNTLYVNQQPIAPLDETGILPAILTNTPSVTLPHTTNSFSVDFASSNYILEINEPVEYLLKGFDSEWITAMSEHITYTNIPPGKYSLHLRAISGSDYIHDAALNIKIKAVWYKSTMAWIIYLLLTTLALYYFNRLYRQRVALSTQLRYEQNKLVDVESENRSKLQFFTNISHEFRTPLSIIIGQIELLLNSNQLNGADRNKVKNIHRSSNELNSLIGELLDFRKHEQGLLSLNIKETNLSEMMSELYEIYCEHIASRNVYFKLHLPTDPVLVNCDGTQIRKVITNLLSNAIKYTCEGDLISLMLDMMEDHVSIRVEDTGSGISTHDINHIFDSFYQGENSQRIGVGGTGIGLSFAKSIVELHGGSISVDSQFGRGTWFVVTIPLSLECSRKGDESYALDDPTIEGLENSLDSTLESADEGRKPRYRSTILVVEDDLMLLNMLVNIFSEQYSVIQAVDGQQGLELARKHLPQIIISDIMMPKVSGIELCRQLKEDLETSHIPIVMLTARGTTEQEVEGINCGADDYITKPFSIKLLLARCNNLVNNRILLQQKYSQQPEENTYKMATNALDQNILERALSIIDTHIDDTAFDIAAFAEEIAMSRTSLFNKIKSITGLTPNDFIMTVRLKRAATLMRESPHRSIVDIAESVGFNGHRYFGKRFKERFGVTPAEYRQGKGQEQ